MAQQNIRKYNGGLYEDLGDGNARYLGPDPDAQQAPRGITIGTPDPTVPLKTQVLQNDVALAPFNAQTAAANARTAIATAKMKEREAAMPPALAPQQAQANDRAKRIRSLAGQIDRVQELFDAGPGSTKGLGGLADYNPWSDANNRFDAAGASLSEQGLGAFRVPGTGEVSNRDAIMFEKANLPSADKMDATVEEQLRGLRARVDEEFRAMGQQPYDWRKANAQDRSAALPQMTGPQQGQIVFGGNTRQEQDPKAAALVDTLIRRGASADEINAAVTPLGFDPVDAGMVKQAQDYLRKNPGYKGSFGSAVRNVPVNPTISAIGSSAAGAGLINAAEAITGGYLDNLTDNPEATRNAMAQLSAQNPGSALTGQVLGGALAAGGLELGAGMAAGRAGFNAASKAIPRLADAAYGALAGSGNADDGSRLTGAATGAAAGLGGGEAGRFVGRALASTIAPTGGNMAATYARGVYPTVGQRFADSGIVGKAINTGEQALQSVPLAGSMVARAREIPREQFELGAFNEALGEIGQALPKGTKPGTAPNAFAQKAFNDVYDQARSGMQFVPDAQFAQELGAWQQDLMSGVLSQEQTKRVQAIISNAVGSRVRNGGMNGEGFKAASSALAAASRKTGNDPLVSDALANFGGLFDNAARRSSNPEAVAMLDAADRGYAKLVRIEQAAAARGGEPGRFSPKQFDRAVQQTSGKVRSKAYLRGDALMQDYADAGRGLSDTLPNSGSAERLMTGQAVGAGGLGGLGSLIGMGTIAKGAPLLAPYVPGVNHTLTRLIAPRTGAWGQVLNPAGDWLRQREALFGLLGAGSAPMLAQ
jgi:hypothetical protein